MLEGFDDLMGGLLGKNNMAKKLMKLIKGEDICEGCDSAKYSEITALNGNEMEEWASIKAEGNRINNEVEKIAKQRELLNARKKILIGKIQLRFGEHRSRIVIKNGKALKVECVDDCTGLLPPM